MAVTTRVDLARFAAALGSTVATAAADGLVEIEDEDGQSLGYVDDALSGDLATAETLCRRYSSAAPRLVLTEAVVRVVGFLRGPSRSGKLSTVPRLKVGSSLTINVDGAAAAGDPVRRSGAAAVLRTYRRRTIAVPDE